MRTPRAARIRTLLAVGTAIGGVFTWGALSSAQGATADQEATAADLPADTVFHNYPLQAHDWVADNPGDPRAAVISERITSQPQGVWFSSYQPSTVTQDVAEVTSAASAAGEVPVLVSYMIPDRDCGGASAGGAPDLPSYLSWTQGFAAGLGDDPVVVILEPDALALSDCLEGADRTARFDAISEAAATLHAANPEARVYFDIGHSAWHEPAAIADVLRQAGILENGDGVFSNVSNYRTTQDEVAFTEAVLNELGAPADLGAVIDTSRNGNGPAGSEWCDPPGRLVGENPTVNTGSDLVDAFLWVKPPGELDGCDGPAGQFSPDKAVELAGG
ncbi:glycoside hydrolase family 6 protein [Streptomyces sp. PT12]|uniref:glycoside hydrolase family 6 protein n=1 Tax=Streptomyces sp. PT12 TaxID=1510197 RepID=UPI000DE494D3|nr:glycoside hydrolase family 6 protein [Streptomyces sp. PT12]RBM18269.1 endoglucanase 1 [Streptomyces sp. PT12]